MPSLLEIERAWRILEPQRAEGGRRALAGFSYQLWISLDRFFSSIANGDQDASFAFEGLSDLASSDGRSVYLTQVKSTLSQDALRASANEALAVDRFLELHYNELRDNFFFQVVTRRTPSNTPEFGTLSAEDLRLKGEPGERWNNIRHRFLPLSIQSDPYFSLAVKLFSSVTKVFDFLDIAIGKVFHLLGANRNSSAISEDLLRLWDSRRTDSPPPPHLLSVRDWTPVLPSGPQILVGERPSITDVTRGCFMERPQRLYKALEQITELQRAVSRRKLPILWLEGTSGVGKSVLLLQVLRELTLEGSAPVHFLRHFSSRLPDAILYWKNEKRRPIIAVDDLYSPDDRSLADVWNSLFDLSYDEHWLEGLPLVLTAGPFEYYDSFSRESDRRGNIEVILSQVEHLDEPEKESYRQWFNERTGSSPNPVPEQNFVALAFAYELQRNRSAPRLDQFAARFEERVHELGILDAVQCTLSLNSLGASAPLELFKANPRALDQLSSEGIFRIRESNDGLNVRLYHTTIAAAIYDELTRLQRSSTQARDLTLCIRAILNDRPRASSLIEFLSQPRIRERLGPAAVKAITNELSLLLSETAPPDVPIAVIHTFLTVFGMELDRSSIRRLATRIKGWLQTPTMNSEGWGLCFQFLGRLPDISISNELLRNAIHWLASNSESPSWNYVWQTRWRVRRDDEAAQLGISWLRQHPDSVGWTFVWQALWNDLHTDELRAVALEWLDIHISHRGWTYVFEFIFAAHPDLPQVRRLARAWIASAPVTLADPHMWPALTRLLDIEESVRAIIVRMCRIGVKYAHERCLRFLVSQPSVDEHLISAGLHAAINATYFPHFWQNLVNFRSHELYQASAREWLVKHHDQPEWNYVWQRLLEFGSDPDVLELGREWLNGRETNPAWAFIYQRLLELHPEMDILVEVGLKWLEHNHDRPEWSYLFVRLSGVRGLQMPLLALGRQWLVGREDQQGWPFVCLALLRGGRDEELIDTASQWLSNREDRPGWAALLQFVIRHRSPHVDLYQAAVYWLERYRDQPEWSYVWEFVLASGIGDRNTATSLAFSWLDGREDRPAWPYIFNRLVELGHQQQQLANLGRCWLVGREDRREWSRVWQALLTISQDDCDLLDRGRSWLINREAQVDWPFVYQALLEASGGEDLLEHGIRWLARDPLSPGWSWVWEKVVSRRGVTPQLRDLAKRWMVRNPHHHRCRFIRSALIGRSR